MMGLQCWLRCCLLWCCDRFMRCSGSLDHRHLLASKDKRLHSATTSKVRASPGSACTVGSFLGPALQWLLVRNESTAPKLIPAQIRCIRADVKHYGLFVDSCVGPAWGNAEVEVHLVGDSC